MDNKRKTPDASEIYEPKSILFTGGAGFIGSNVMAYILQQHPNTKLICLDSLAPCANIRNCEDLRSNPNFLFVQGSICSSDLVAHLLAEHQVDTVMHFAAETHVDNSFGNSLKFTQSNIVGTHVLLEACKFHKPIRRFIHVSTDEVYGESSFDGEKNTEQSKLDPTNPYAATKAAAEFLVRAYHKSFGLPVIITRGNNVYGPRQYPEKLIPKFITLLSQGKACPLHGDGSNLRSFLYVDDVSKAFDIILEKGEMGKTYNIGSHVELSNKEVLGILMKKFNLTDTDKYVKFVRDRAFNDRRYHIDTIALNELGWKQEIDFDEGLGKTVQWYTTHPGYWNENTLLTATQAHPTLPAAGSSIAE